MTRTASKRTGRGRQAQAARKEAPRKGGPRGLSRAELSEITVAASPRAERQAERRQAILDAALDEFAAAGFAAARLDDVAKRAGVAKGTIYLYFSDKESLFHELVRSMLSPLVGKLVAAPKAELPARAIAEMIADVFVNDIFATRRK